MQSLIINLTHNEDYESWLNCMPSISDVCLNCHSLDCEKTIDEEDNLICEPCQFGYQILPFFVQNKGLDMKILKELHELHQKEGKECHSLKCNYLIIIFENICNFFNVLSS